MSVTLGNDVASYQGIIDFEVYKNNSNFIIIKATEGNGFTDPRFKRNQSESRRVGLARGYYHFARPDLGNTPKSEADFFIKTLGDLENGEIVVLDYEPNNQVNQHVLWCKEWLDYVTEKLGCKPLIYLNQSQVMKFDWNPIVKAGYGLWIAAYTNNPQNNQFIKGQWPFAAMQQWTNSQKVPGINAGAVDGNVFFGDIETFKKYGFKKQTPNDPTEQLKAELKQAKEELESVKTELYQERQKTTFLQLKIDKAREVLQ